MPIEKYGLKWPEHYNELMIELRCFREDSAKFNIPKEQRPFHFKNIVRILWGPKSSKPFVWNPWADLMLIHACDNKYLSLSGCAGCGKSTFSAIWAIVNWLAEPDKTMVMVTSTSLEEARGRIWGDVEAFFNAGNESMNKIQKGSRLPGRLLGSIGRIRTQDGNERFDDKCGIKLVSGDRAKEKENIGKLIGFHNSRVILVADELPELSPALASAAKSNLEVNPFFQMIGIGNFKSVFDPFGIFSEPDSGWGSVTPDNDQWKTKEGYCLRFDGMRSPNVLLGAQKYPGMYGPENLETHRKRGEHTALFWRMCRSFPCPEADVDRVYSDADLLKGEVRGLVKWKTTPTKCAAMDPAFATGGDKAMGYFGLLGISVEGKQTLLVTRRKEYQEDVRNKIENRALQVVKQFIADCIADGIDPSHVAYDGSGGGTVVGSLITEIWKNEGHKTLGVQFGGAASDRAVSVKDRRPAREAFINRVSEIWFAGVDFIQSGQIKGLPQQACVELTERRKKMPVKSGANVKNCVESKKEMKLRTRGDSPDDADAFLILLELCRVRLNFRASGIGNAIANVKSSWKQKVGLANKIYRNANYEPEVLAA